MDSLDPDWHAECEAIVRSLLARHGWQLIEHEAFVARLSEVYARGVASSPQRAAIHLYTLTLYAACSGKEGAQRQEIAYQELFDYLRRSALHRYGDLADDASQLAIERIFTHFGRCRQPGAFLAWAFQQLRDAVRTLRRHEERLPTVPLDGPRNDDRLSLLMRLPAPSQINPDEQLAQRELDARLRAMVSAFLRRHPRAEQQLTAFLLKHLWGMDDVAIGLRLDKKVESVHVLRSRAKKKLQQDEGWIALAQELGIH